MDFSNFTGPNESLTKYELILQRIKALVKLRIAEQIAILAESEMDFHIDIEDPVRSIAGCEELLDSYILAKGELIQQFMENENEKDAMSDLLNEVTTERNVLNSINNNIATLKEKINKYKTNIEIGICDISFTIDFHKDYIVAVNENDQEYLNRLWLALETIFKFLVDMPKQLGEQIIFSPKLYIQLERDKENLINKVSSFMIDFKAQLHTSGLNIPTEQPNYQPSLKVIRERVARMILEAPLSNEHMTTFVVGED